jgi:hypothetical protein
LIEERYAHIDNHIRDGGGPLPRDWKAKRFPPDLKRTEAMFATKLLGMFDRIALPLFRTIALGGLSAVAMSLVVQG